MGYTPAGTVAATWKIRDDAPLPLIAAGLKLAVMPFGRPATDSAIAELKPPDAVPVTGTAPELPAVTVSEPVEVREKFGTVTVSVTVVTDRVFGMFVPAVAVPVKLIG
jgi:hypothetical protein